MTEIPQWSSATTCSSDGLQQEQPIPHGVRPPAFFRFSLQPLDSLLCVYISKRVRLNAKKDLSAALRNVCVPIIQPKYLCKK